MNDDGFESTQPSGEEEDVHRAFILNQLQAGSQPAEIIEMLVQDGVGSGKASYLVENTQQLLNDAVAAERVTGASIISGAVGGLLAAALGGTIWALVTAGTNTEFGIIAWGIGGLCGFAVVLFARGKKGVPLQLAAVLSSVVGILGGKYGWVYLSVQAMAETEVGAEEAQNISFFSPELIALFFENAGEWLSGFDLVFIGLAIFTAWGIPKAGGLGSLLRKGV